jgi:hypothetical protein
MPDEDPPIPAYRVIEVDPQATELPADCWVTAIDAARFLGLSREQIRRLVDKGKLTSRKLRMSGPTGFRYMISTDELNRLKEERGRGAVPR